MDGNHKLEIFSQTDVGKNPEEIIVIQIKIFGGHNECTTKKIDLQGIEKNADHIVMFIYLQK